jgi:sarcosine oxidase subunit beta
MNVAVVGGGLMGLSAAFHVRRLDPSVAVTVLERAHAGAAASGASAAGVRVMGRHPAERALALESLSRWPDLDRELDGKTRYRRDGGLRVALDLASWHAVPAWIAEQRADGVPLEMLDAPAARKIAPDVSPATLGAVFSPLDGQAEAMPTVLAFAAAARRLGAKIDDGADVRSIVVERGRVVAVDRRDGRREACDVAIVAAGAWSVRLLAAHGLRLPFETRALQMLLTEPAPRSLAPVVGCFDRKLSLKQLGDGAYLIGGGWPGRITDEAANAWEVLDESVAASRAVAAEVYPPVARCRIARRWTGLEAFTPDEIPIIGPVPGVDGLFVAAGFSGHGFALSPAVGDILARLALGRDARENLWRGLAVERLARERATT